MGVGVAAIHFLAYLKAARRQLWVPLTSLYLPIPPYTSHHISLYLKAARRQLWVPLIEKAAANDPNATLPLPLTLPYPYP